MFYAGGGVAAALIPVVFFLVPESVLWLAKTQPRDALQRINHALGKLGHPAVHSLPAMTAPEREQSIYDIFSPRLIRITFIVLAAYSLHMATFYFLIKWIPVIVTDFGFNAALASGVLTWTNIGAATGGFIFGVLSTRVGLKPLTIAILFLSAAAIVIFGRAPSDLGVLKILAACAGFFTNAAISGIYSIVAFAFPTHVRATGTGFVVGVGRGGAVISPVVAGYLFQWQFPFVTVALIMASGSFIAAIALCFIQLKPREIQRR